MTDDLSGLLTESRNVQTMNLDQLSPMGIAELMNREDENTVRAVHEALPQIAEAIRYAAESLAGGGRIIYMGAGTSGRLGVLDAAECPPTFGVPEGLVVGLIAGGEEALKKAVEGAEDDEKLGETDLRNLNVNHKDIVIGLSASGRAPYVQGGLRFAGSRGCRTVAIICNRNTVLERLADVAIVLLCGPEVLAGSTRLKAGTAQKMVLNMISTGSMVGNGKTYQNLMVDVVQTNEKLVKRAENIVMEATGCLRETAAVSLAAAGGSAKLAIAMIIFACDAATAREELEKAKGSIRALIEEKEKRYGKSKEDVVC